jgi:hypothetical protein
VLPLSCLGAQPRGNWNAPAHWIVAAQLEFFNFRCKCSYSAYYRNLLSATQWSGCVKVCCSEKKQVHAGVKKLEGTLEDSHPLAYDVVLQCCYCFPKFLRIIFPLFQGLRGASRMPNMGSGWICVDLVVQLVRPRKYGDPVLILTSYDQLDQ